VLGTSYGKWYEQKVEEENWLSEYTLCYQNWDPWGRSAHAGATKRIKFEFGERRGRHGENRTSQRRTYRSRLPRSCIWVTSKTYTGRNE